MEANPKGAFEKFAKETVAEKKPQLKGCEAWLYIIKLNMFVHKMLEDKNVSKEVVSMVDSLVEIINIVYTKQEF